MGAKERVACDLGYLGDSREVESRLKKRDWTLNEGRRKGVEESGYELQFF